MQLTRFIKEYSGHGSLRHSCKSLASHCPAIYIPQDPSTQRIKVINTFNKFLAAPFSTASMPNSTSSPSKEEDEHDTKNKGSSSQNLQNQNINNSELISLEYPRTTSFNKEDQKQLAEDFGISNLEIKHDTHLNQYTSNNDYSSSSLHRRNIGRRSKEKQIKSNRRKRIIPSTTSPPPYPDLSNTNSPINQDLNFQSPSYNNTTYPLYNQNPSHPNSQHSFNNNRTSSPDIKARIRVKSVHAARTIDIVSIVSKVFTRNEKFPKPLRYRFGKSSVIIKLPPTISKFDAYPIRSHSAKTLGNENKNYNYHHVSQDDTIRVHDAFTTSPTNTTSTKQNNDGISNNHQKVSLDEDQMRYVVVFRFGSVVLFNIAPTESQAMLQEIKKYSVDPVATGFEQKENYEVAICPGLSIPPYNQSSSPINDIPNPSLVNGDYASIQNLDINNVAVISTIMAQTVAMDSYNVIVDELLATFAKINAVVKKEGKFSEMERETLLKVVAMNNAIFIDMVSKLGVMDRSDTAWNFSQYETVFEEMKDEFEIYNRFENIEFKLNLIQDNAKFFLEGLQGQKSNTLEWAIIVLIALEGILMILDMSGLGSELFSSLLSTNSLSTSIEAVDLSRATNDSSSS